MAFSANTDDRGNETIVLLLLEFKPVVYKQQDRVMMQKRGNLLY